MSQKLFICPYNSAHVMKMSRAHHHIVDCRKAHIHKNYVICSYNALHHYPIEKEAEHLAICADRMAIIDSNCMQYEEGPHIRGNLTIPPPPKIISEEEEWD